jgi:putative flippase GtrA
VLEPPRVSAPEKRLAERRAARALRRPANWFQLGQFSIVGGTGYIVNLAVYTLLVTVVGVHYLLAAVCSFVVAVTNNYTWNRIWTFRHQRGHVAYQGMRFFVVAVLALGLNLVLLRLLVTLGVGRVLAQAIAIALVMPVNFLGNKLWSFR